MIIEYRPMATGGAETNVWRALPPPTDQYLYVGSSYSIWMVPGYEEFHNV